MRKVLLAFLVLSVFSFFPTSAYADSINLGWGHAGTIVRSQGVTRAGGVVNVWGLGWKTSIAEFPVYFETGVAFSATKFQPSPRILVGPLFLVNDFIIYPHLTYQYTPSYSGLQPDHSFAGAVVLGVKVDKVLLGLVLSVGVVGIEDPGENRRYVFAIGPKVSIPLVGW